MDSSDNQTTTCDDCMVCLCPMNVPTDTITTNCGHIFHTECISTWHDKQTNEFNCPACRESLKLTPKIIYDIPDSNNTLCTYFNGDTLEGVRENGEFIGQCKYTFVCGTFLEGERKNGEFIGQCKQTCVDGTFLEGERKNGEFIGQCKETYVLHNITRVRECEVKNGMFKYKHKFHIGTPVFQYDTKSRLITRFDSIKSCAKSLKTSRHQITNRLNGVKCRDPAIYPANYYLNQYVFSVTKL